MRLSDDFEDRNSGAPVAYAALAAAGLIAVIVGTVFFSNQKPKANKNEANAETASQEAVVNGSDSFQNGGGVPASDDPYISGSSLRSEDLDFWHMYDEERAKEEAEQSKKEKEKEEEEKKEQDPSTDGKHTLLLAEDGTEEWVSINPYLTKSNYDYSGLVYQYPIMKYYEDSEKVSKVGISVNADDGDIDFKKLKKAGVDFAMIRVASRGYGSGQLMDDDMLYENIRKASEAEMDFGVVLYSQAITNDEAIEEANRVIEALQGFTVIYPVAFDMEYVKNDTARVQALTRDQKTEIAMTFLNAVQQAGYKAMIYGNKEWLIRRVDLTKLIGYDVWFSQEQDVPDYPYKFTMWEYTKSAKIDGMDEPAKLSICFIDYAAK